ncbi:ComF family protein [Maliponia aquimaris]|uniref:DNA utilization protein GntX n=1 Tax=Maliponia aquimaris TaxID=1673631 RepID=A0A238JPM8_9RHOB|nr:double zinc ribbon domain-containing protein [Maliponia aquimaris]SMX32485.1 DNA utilization protein GntX [Maliponia aquimaris]
MLAHRLWSAGMQTLVQLVYPPRCLGCGGLVETDFGLCGPCWRETPFISGLACDLCGVPLPGQSDRAELCDDCLTIARPWAHGRAALVYRDRGRRMVLALKHGDRHDIARPAARWIARAARDLRRDDLLLVPVPLHVTRHLKRRYNQAALLAEALAAELDCPWCPDALVRPTPTPPLEGHGREARFATLSGRITPRAGRRDLIAGRPVLIVDDVMTTGATLAAATEACLDAGATEVFVCVLARAAKDT